jgi:hypothetical protein
MPLMFDMYVTSSRCYLATVAVRRLFRSRHRWTACVAQRVRGAVQLARFNWRGTAAQLAAFNSAVVCGTHDVKNVAVLEGE